MESIVIGPVPALYLFWDGRYVFNWISTKESIDSPEQTKLPMFHQMLKAVPRKGSLADSSYVKTWTRQCWYVTCFQTLFCSIHISHRYIRSPKPFWHFSQTKQVLYWLISNVLRTISTEWIYFCKWRVRLHQYLSLLFLFCFLWRRTRTFTCVRYCCVTDLREFDI